MLCIQDHTLDGFCQATEARATYHSSSTSWFPRAHPTAQLSTNPAGTAQPPGALGGGHKLTVYAVGTLSRTVAPSLERDRMMLYGLLAAATTTCHQSPTAILPILAEPAVIQITGHYLANVLNFEVGLERAKIRFQRPPKQLQQDLKAHFRDRWIIPALRAFVSDEPALVCQPRFYRRRKE